MDELIYNRRLEEAKELLREILETLENMTTDEFSNGADEEIRQKISDFLEIKND